MTQKEQFLIKNSQLLLQKKRGFKPKKAQISILPP